MTDDRLCDIMERQAGSLKIFNYMFYSSSTPNNSNLTLLEFQSVFNICGIQNSMTKSLMCVFFLHTVKPLLKAHPKWHRKLASQKWGVYMPNLLACHETGHSKEVLLYIHIFTRYNVVLTFTKIQHHFFYSFVHFGWCMKMFCTNWCRITETVKNIQGDILWAISLLIQQNLWNSMIILGWTVNTKDLM